MKGKRQFLVVGHPRSGTGYAAWLLQQRGFDVGHERMGEHGTSSWLFAVHQGPYPFTFDNTCRDRFKFEQVIHIIREPVAAIASVFHTEHGSEEFRSRYLTLYGDPLTRAVQSYIGWNRLIASKRVDVVRKTETLHTLLNVTRTPAERVNSRQHEPLTLDDIRSNIDGALFYELMKLIAQYNNLP